MGNRRKAVDVDAGGGARSSGAQTRAALHLGKCISDHISARFGQRYVGRNAIKY